MVVLIASSSLLLALFAWWTLRTPRRPEDPLDAAYLKLCGKLARVGAARAPAEGPLAFANGCAAPACAGTPCRTCCATTRVCATPVRCRRRPRYGCSRAPLPRCAFMLQPLRLVRMILNESCPTLPFSDM